MSDHDALLAAILAEPAEDMPRLLLAEWLDENAGTVECKQCWGDPKANIRFDKATWRYRWDCPTCSGTGYVSDGRAERAEFIRVQCELARNPDSFPGDGNGIIYVWPEAYHDLRRRERELLDDYGYRWIKAELPELSQAVWGLVNEPLRDVERRNNATFSRGFVSSLTCTWAAWREHADAILAAQPIERCKWTTPPTFDDMAKYGIRWEGPDDEYHASAWPSITFELPAERITRGVMITLPEGYIVSDPSYAHATALRTRPQRVDEPHGIPPVSPD